MWYNAEFTLAPDTICLNLTAKCASFFSVFDESHSPMTVLSLFL